MNSRFIRKAIEGAVAKMWEDGWLNIIEPYFQNVNISSSIIAGRDVGVTGWDLDLILENNSEICADESW